ncbi:MAG: glycosyltransferase family 9 protein [Proteobacteria bacterium]|nr:glycosyltransferase family 9 protein [Pseudomonadota bacterium]
MNVLFITSSRLGDAVLSTGLLDHITRTHPEARITVVCGGLPAPLFEGVPGLGEIIVLKKKSFNRHWVSLWKRVAGRKWDIVVDLRNSAVSRLIRAKKIYVHNARIDRSLHKVEQNAAVMKLIPPPPPRLWPTDAQMKVAKELMGESGGPVLAVGPTANWPGKMWPVENFIELVAAITARDGILPHARVAVFAAPEEESAARRVLQSVPAERQINMIAECDPGTASAALTLCDLYIGNDSGLMHCAAAASVPTLGLFGPSWPHLYRPWGEKAAYVSTPESYDELTDYEGYNPKKIMDSLMRSLTVEAVAQTLGEFFNCSDCPSRLLLRK